MARNFTKGKSLPILLRDCILEDCLEVGFRVCHPFSPLVPQRDPLVRHKRGQPAACRRACKQEFKYRAHGLVRDDAANALHHQIIVSPPDRLFIIRDPVDDAIQSDSLGDELDQR